MNFQKRHRAINKVINLFHFLQNIARLAAAMKQLQYVVYVIFKLPKDIL